MPEPKLKKGEELQLRHEMIPKQKGRVLSFTQDCSDDLERMPTESQDNLSSKKWVHSRKGGLGWVQLGGALLKEITLGFNL